MKKSDSIYDLKGTLTANATLGSDSWFRCGGTADLLFSPSDFEDLAAFLKSNTAPITILGGMANTIIRDGGVLGTVIRLGKGCANIEALDNNQIKAEAGALNGSIAAAALKNNIGSLEFLSGIPGTLGGAVKMNAGAYGAEMRNVLVEVHLMDRDGNIHIKTPDELGMSYRHTNINEDMIVIAAILKGQADTYEAVKTHLTEIKKKRNDTQPIKEKTGGSTFANPSAEELKAAGLPETMRAWEIVDKVGGRGLTIGGAQMSEKHCNFMINTGSATATDLESLGDELIRRAQEQLGIALHWEIKRIGEK
ncbi:UDP-N-acetylmuramate dehydrogenase [Alphaproteobacteria bacterium]|nr:UDP-N-acetylmuramate dehydrogenase [Alphaproteobacteria bacterium]